MKTSVTVKAEKANEAGYKSFNGELKQTEAFNPERAGLPKGTVLNFILEAGLVSVKRSSGDPYAALLAKTADDREITVGWGGIIGDVYMIDDENFNPADHAGEEPLEIEGIFRCQRYGAEAHGASVTKKIVDGVPVYTAINDMPEKLEFDAESNIVPVIWDKAERKFVIDGESKLRKGAGYVSSGKLAKA